MVEIARVLFLFVLFLCCSSLVSATIMGSTNFNASAEVVSSGGGDVSSTNFQINGTGVVGESEIGNSSSTNFVLLGGFVQVIQEAAASGPSDPNSGGTVTLGIVEPPTGFIGKLRKLPPYLWYSILGVLVVCLFFVVRKVKEKKDKRDLNVVLGLNSDQYKNISPIA